MRFDTSVIHAVNDGYWSQEINRNMEDSVKLFSREDMSIMLTLEIPRLGSTVVPKLKEIDGGC